MKKVNFTELLLLPVAYFRSMNSRELVLVPVKVSKTNRALLPILGVLLFSSFLSAQTITTCNQLFFDDGGAAQPYTENGSNIPSTTTFTICPSNPITQVTHLEFNQFDIEPGDVVRAYDGVAVEASALITTSNTSGSGTGSSVADAPGGGSVQASCDNLTGCLTLQFTRNNDGTIGSGWTFAATCKSRPNYNFPANGITSQITKTSTCGQFVPIEIPLPTYTDCNNGALVVSTDCSQATVASGSTNATIIVNAPIGKTTVTFTSPLFPSQQHKIVLNVYPPNLTCNDEVSVSLLNECTVALTPDMILENPCMGDYFTYQIRFVDPNLNQQSDVRVIGQTLDGFPIVDLSNLTCGTKLTLTVTRTTNINCGNDIVEECTGDLIVTDRVAPILMGEVDEYIIPCYYDTQALLGRLNAIPRDGRGATLVLNPLGVNVPTNNYDLPLVIEPVSRVFGIQEACAAEFTVSAWQEIVYDCTTNAFSGLIASADDPIWALIETEVIGTPALFRSYFRVVQAVDDCGNESNIAIQRIVVVQPDLVFPELEIELPCDADPDPLAIYQRWASDPDWYADYGTYIPNFDPTPLDVNGNFNLLGGLDDTYFTNASGDEVPLFPKDGACGYAVDWQDSNPIYSCENSYKIFREWTVFNFCDGHLELIDIVPTGS
ncbi:MAG: hypothetical protein HC892_09565 [Saprospiraceae bacterium]|nr:hypothetical protein [Saprospiraceae bacterium]